MVQFPTHEYHCLYFYIYKIISILRITGEQWAVIALPILLTRIVFPHGRQRGKRATSVPCPLLHTDLQDLLL